MFSKKILSIAILFCYVVSQVLSYLGYIQRGSVYASGESKNTYSNLVAVLVDERVYPEIENELKWYTTEYIQKKYDQSKALVLKINTQEYSAPEITKLLENLYFEWEKEKSSQLIGLVMIWEIPFPVVKYSDYVFPSIYPYVDFLDQKYLWNEWEWYFTQTKQNGQAEIWHWVINFKSDADAYKRFFQKLKNYDADPSKFADKKVRYDDFVALQSNFLEENYQLYKNRLVFAEDLMYNRYTNLLFDFFQKNDGQKVKEMVNDLEDALKDLGDKTAISGSFSNSSEAKTPTKMLKKKIDGHLQEYSSSLSVPLQRAIADNIEASNRWTWGADTHQNKLQIKDQLTLWTNEIDGIIRGINDKLEKMVDNKVLTEKYEMKSVIPTLYKKEREHRILVKFWVWRLSFKLPFRVPEHKDLFRFYYFWRDSSLLTSAEQSSIYRGTFRNLEKVWNYATIINNSDNPAKSNLDQTNLQSKSFWSSYDIFSTQVETNRGFNMMNSKAEYELYSKEKTHASFRSGCVRRYFGLPDWTGRFWIPCQKYERQWEGTCSPQSNDSRDRANCESFQQFWNRVRGWATPLNVDSEKMTQWIYRFANGFDYRSAWQPIFDIAGSAALTQKQTRAYTYEWLKEYSSPTQISYREWNYREPTRHGISYNQVDYFNQDLSDKYFNKIWSNSFSLLKPKRYRTDEERFYQYRTISSEIKHKATTSDQIETIKKPKYNDESREKFYQEQILQALNTKDFETPSQVSRVMWGRIDNISSHLTTLFSGLQSIYTQENERKNIITEREQKLQERINLLEQAKNHLRDRWSSVTVNVELLQNRFNALKAVSDKIWELYTLVYKAPLDNSSLAGIVASGKRMLDWMRNQSLGVNISYQDSGIKTGFNNILSQYLTGEIELEAQEQRFIASGNPISRALTGAANSAGPIWAILNRIIDINNSLSGLENRIINTEKNIETERNRVWNQLFSTSILDNNVTGSLTDFFTGENQISILEAIREQKNNLLSGFNFLVRERDNWLNTWGSVWDEAITLNQKYNTKNLSITERIALAKTIQDQITENTDWTTQNNAQIQQKNAEVENLYTNTLISQNKNYVNEWKTIAIKGNTTLKDLRGDVFSIGWTWYSFWWTLQDSNKKNNYFLTSKKIKCLENPFSGSFTLPIRLTWYWHWKIWTGNDITRLPTSDRQNPAPNRSEDWNAECFWKQYPSFQNLDNEFSNIQQAINSIRNRQRVLLSSWAYSQNSITGNIKILREMSSPITQKENDYNLGKENLERKRVNLFNTLRRNPENLSQTSTLYQKTDHFVLLSELDLLSEEIEVFLGRQYLSPLKEALQLVRISELNKDIPLSMYKPRYDEIINKLSNYRGELSNRINLSKEAIRKLMRLETQLQWYKTLLENWKNSSNFSENLWASLGNEMLAKVNIMIEKIHRISTDSEWNRIEAFRGLQCLGGLTWDANCGEGNYKIDNLLQELDEQRGEFQKIFKSENENPEITIKGMSDLTPDRPIDSPRYTSFQWVGGNKIQLIYPNIFKSEVYNQSGTILQLKSQSEFKAALEKYLKNKVNEYNTILSTEKNKAAWVYASKRAHYERLLWVDPLATPLLEYNRHTIRRYNPFTYEEVLQSIGGEKMLNTVAELLYYQNIGIKSRSISDDIERDIASANSSFNINNKVEYILNSYLTQNKDKELSKKGLYPQMIVPNYATKGYEVWFINSSNNDTINTQGNIQSSSETTIRTSSEKNKGENEISTEQGDINNDQKECWFNFDEALLLFDIKEWKSPRLEALGCWLEEVKKKPFEISISANGAVWSLSNLWDAVNPLDDIQDSFNDKNGSNSSSTKQIISTVDTPDKTTDTILEKIEITTSSKKFPVDSWTWILSLKIRDPKLIDKDLEVVISSTGANCLVINEEDDCNKKVSKSFKWSLNWENLDIKLHSNNAGLFATTIEVCPTDDKDQCGRKTLTFNATVWAIDSIKIDTNSKLWAGIYSLVKLTAFDKYKNPVSRSLDPYILTVDKGGFLAWWELQKEIEITDFDGENIIYRSLPEEIWEVNLSIRKAKETRINAKTHLQLVKTTLQIKQNWAQITKPVNYQLTEKPVFIWEWKNRKINSEKVLKFDLSLNDEKNNIIALNTKASIKISNGKFKSYVLDETSDTTAGTEILLRQTDTITFKDGKASIYLIPTNKSGEEKVSFIIPGLKEQSYQIQVLPGEASKLTINMDKKMAEIWEKINGQISLTDLWWNAITKPTEILLTSADSQKLITNKVILSWGKVNISYTFEEDQESSIIEAKVLWTKQPIKDSIRLIVQKKLLNSAVNSGLNIMYLNLFWTDRGNQRGYLSDKEQYSEKILKNSEKTLAVTTQLTDLKKVKKASLILKSHWKLDNIDQLPISAALKGNKLVLNIGKLWNINIQDNIKNIKMLNSGAMLSQVLNETRNPSLIIYDLADEYTYSKWILYNKDKIKLASRDDDLSLNLGHEKEEWYPVWNLIRNGKSIAKVLIPHLDYAKSYVDSKDWKLNDTRRSFNDTYQWGSTSKIAKGIFNIENTLDTTYQGYESIQDSNDYKKYIGFRADFKNITLFAWGKTVWEATIPFGSEFLVNIWDPLLKRIEKNSNIENADYNWGIEKTIYSDPNNTIWKVLDIDYNNDGLRDLLVIYEDGSIKLQKQYADKKFQDMELLMMTAEQMEEVYVWDVDGNGYEDILIKNTKKQLRAYLNEDWIFDVDWRIACLNTNVRSWEISKDPSNLSGTYQVFIKDMDLDKKLDIVTYDHMWDIKIFYWNGNKSNHSYLSTNEYTCDENWYNRQKSSSKTIHNLWVEINPQPVKDGSLVRRGGLKIPSNEELNSKASEDATKGITDQIPGNVQAMLNGNQTVDPQSIIGGVTKLDMTNAVQSTLSNYAKYIQNPIQSSNLSLNDRLKQKDQAFIAINTLDGQDKLEVTKSYRDINWGNLIDKDEVEVTVKIKAATTITSGAFLDKLYLPANLEYTSGGLLKNLEFLENKAVLQPNLWEYPYGITDFSLNTWDQLVYRYKFEYKDQLSPYSLKIEDVNIKDYEYKDIIKKSEPQDGMAKDGYPDIILWAQDWCIKQKWVLFNQWRWSSRQYNQKSINLQELAAAYEKEARDAQNKAREEQLKKLQDQKAITENWLSSVLKDPDQEKWVKNNLLKSFELAKKIGEEISRVGEDAWNTNEEIRKGVFRMLLSGDGSRESAWNQILEAFKNWKFKASGVYNIGWAIDDIAWALLSTDINKLSENINKGLDMLCQWVSFGLKGKKSCKGLPVPFNQAFLAPWDYHVMWCIPIPPLTRTLGRGIPVFHFPGTLPTPVGNIPFPRGQKGPWDEFLWVGWWIYPSLIRIYAAPTLTAQLGLAICAGPQKLALAMKSPFADLGGNCIVTAFSLPCWDWEGDGNSSGDGEWYDNWAGEYWSTNTCSDSTNTGSPLRNVGFNWISKNTEIKLPVIGIFNAFTPHYEPSNFWNNDFSVGKNTIWVWFTRIDGVNDTKNKIRNPNGKGIPAILMGFLENQIEYIRNNLLRWNLKLYLPDIKKIWKQISSIALASQALVWEEGKEIASQIKDSRKSIPANIRKAIKNPQKVQKNDVINIDLMWGDNPFEELQRLFNRSDLVKISTKTIPVKIPWIYSEDIEAYSNYLKWWLSTQKKTLDTRKEKIWAIVLTCPAEIDKILKKGGKNDETLQAKIKECEAANWANIKLARFSVKLDKTSERIYENIQILEQYKRLPFEIYEWIHVLDKYVAELSSVITNFFGYINYRMEINANRFSQYIDAITTILAVVKTYQVMLDFSANRTAKCWTCTNDAYDQYACKLSFLCWGLKIDPIPIPSMKLPNLTIDLSHLDLWLDITLPKFNFIPESIELPRIPNLPTPPAIGVSLDVDLGFDIPEIGLLPEPPSLPELPSLLPRIKMNLPILPPAPKLPQLPDKISKILNLANKIGQIICRVKGKVGLVGESSVKAKIEQLTQRTYSVPFVDNIDLTAKLRQAPLQWLDYQIDAFVNLEYSFDGFYTLLKGLTDGLNNTVNEITSQANNAVAVGDEFSQNIMDKADEAIKKAEWTTVRTKISAFIGTDNTTGEQNEYLTTKTQLAKELQSVIDHLNSEQEKNQIKSLISLVKTETKVEANKQGYQEIKNQISSLINTHQTSTHQIAELIKKDYDGFLASLDTQNQKQKAYQLTYTTPLLMKNAVAEELIKKNESIIDTYIATETKQVNGYLDALNKNSPSSLNMSEETHRKAKSYLETIKDQVDHFYSIKTPQYAGTMPLLTKDGKHSEKALYAQVSSVAPEKTTQNSADYSSYIKGILVKSKDNKSLINVVHSEYNAEKYESYYQQDMNNDKIPDLISRDEHNVYLKYADDREEKTTNTSTTYYLLSPTLKNKDKKYEKTQNSEFKLYDDVAEVKDFKLKGQTFDELNFSWTNDQVVKNNGYLLRISNRIDSLKEKFGQNDYKYALFLPRGTSITGYKIQLDGKETSIEQLAKVWKLYALDRYNPSNETLNFGLGNIPRNRLYLQVSSLKLRDKVYTQQSPRSNQLVWGRQIIWDSEPPTAEIQLTRSKKSEVTSYGNELEGFVGTYYDLKIKREDSVRVEKVEIKEGNKILASKVLSSTGGIISLENLFFTKKQIKHYTATAIDSEGNEAIEDIALDIKVPEISIENVERFSGYKEGIKNPIIIHSVLETDIDEWDVSFQRKRNGIQKDISAQLQWKATKRFPVSTNQTNITGAFFDFGDMIGLYSISGALLGKVNAQNGEIIFEPSYQNKASLEVVFEKGYPTIKVKENWISIFDISLTPKELKNIQLLKWELRPLKWAQYWAFNWGQALILNKLPLLYISKNGLIAGNKELYGTYSFNKTTETVLYTIKENRFGSEIAKVEVTTLPL